MLQKEQLYHQRNLLFPYTSCFQILCNKRRLRLRFSLHENLSTELKMLKYQSHHLTVHFDVRQNQLKTLFRRLCMFLLLLQ